MTCRTGRSTVSFDRVAVRYDASRGGRARAQQTAAAILPWLTAGGPAIEVGVGTGLVAAEVAATGRTVVGFDVSLRMLERALPRLGRRVAAADAQQLPVRDDVAGSVYFVHVLHLVADMRATFAEAARILRPGGRVLATCRGGDGGVPTDDAARLLAGLRQRLAIPRPDTPDRVAGAAESAGLVVVHREQLRHDLPMSPADCAGALQDRLWSWTWNIDSATWAEQVAPVIAELNALPNSDQPRTMSHSSTMLIFTNDLAEG